ncbi:restriction endonuclease subunit S [Klebsiella quasipneumoniae]|uniref:restriction endonuclease subunit S n=1 Tax=Klebsiella quasipneumoniae TaxID=1463165 RepID=UPI00217EF27B|nr:restriction endonuclease subunit S [Klebsiella quasipneumoniae]MCS6746544.1 restriction endonuclease subunit S [Klebsiella quasipneumoniae]
MVYNSPLGKTKFPLAPVSDGCTFISGYAFKSKDFTDIGYPVIKIKNIHDGFVTLEDSHCVTSKTVEGLKKFRLNNGDVLIAMTGQGSVGRVGRLSFNGDKAPYLNQRVGKFIADEKKLNISYLYYILTTKQYQNILFNNASGSGQPNLSPAVIQSILIPYPEYHLQCEMAKILDEINDRIIKNNAINNTLEQISQTLFKSWFVDFDPVIDNALDAVNSIPEALQSRAELRQKVRNSADFKPLPADVRALFPAEFEETELGWVPKGWESVTFDSFCDLIQSGGTPSRKETSFWDEGTIKWLSSGEVKGKIVLDTKEKITDIGLLNSSAKLWAKYTTVVAMYGATAGEVCLIGDKMTANQACCGLYSEKYPFYVYNFVSDKAYEIASKATGSAQQNLNKLIISSTKFTRPSNAIISIFEDNVAPLFMNWFSNTAENNTLTALRDTLLPKLISGELSLEDLPDLVTQTEPA